MHRSQLYYEISRRIDALAGGQAEGSDANSTVQHMHTNLLLILRLDVA